MSEPLVLPRPGSTFSPQDPIPGPSEEAFTSTFGALLPPAQYLTTSIGKAAYYTFPASTPSPITPDSKVPSKVLLIHGVQTPALGLVPLVTALRSRFPATSFATLDLWGHGLSSTPVLPHSGALFHGLIDGVLRELGWKGKPGVGVVGYSFGAVLSMGYLTSSVCLTSSSTPGSKPVDSLVLIAPAGLLRSSWFSPQQQKWLSIQCAEHDEHKAAEFVVDTLEGGPLVVPQDWQDRVNRGEVVAQAVKDWQMKTHRGHAASVVGVFRDGGVIDNDELFVKAKASGIPSLVVLGAEDGMSTEEEIKRFGFDVQVVPGAGHAVVRENAVEVAEHISRFWKGL